MAEYKNLAIDYGPLGGSLAVQLKAQGFTVKSRLLLTKHEEIRDSIYVLRLRELLTQNETARAFKRLHKMVDKNIEDPTS